MMPWRRKTRLSLGLQIARMRKLFPGFEFEPKGGKWVWKGTLQPTEHSPVYHIKIELSPGKYPKVWVTSPKIADNAPHRYPDKSLCLFYPKDNSWQENMSIADTIVPWTAEWLFYYELWQETGKFWGPEAPHQGPKPKAS